MHQESVLVLAFKLALVFPWDAFWVRSVLSEAVGHPWVTLEVLLQELHVGTLLLLGWDGRWAHFESLICLLCQTVEFLTGFVIKSGLLEDVVICSVELAWHFVFA